MLGVCQALDPFFAESCQRRGLPQSPSCATYVTIRDEKGGYWETSRKARTVWGMPTSCEEAGW